MIFQNSNSYLSLRMRLHQLLLVKRERLKGVKFYLLHYSILTCSRANRTKRRKFIQLNLFSLSR